MLGGMNAPYALPERRGLPLRVDRDAARESAVTSFVRACAAALISASKGRTQSPEAIARSRWPNDRDVALFTRNPSAPAEIGNSTWPVSWLMSAMWSMSSRRSRRPAAKVLGRCMSLEWPPGVVLMNVPAISVSGAILAWTGEGNPIPVQDYTTSAAQLTPRKIAAIIAFTREMAEHSTPNIESLLRVALSESLGLALDNTLFSAAAGDANTPTGIFNGIAPLAASTASIPSEAMTEDISRAVASVAAVAGSNPIVLVMSPRQAASMRVRTHIGDYETFPSPALADGTIAAIATNALASVGDRAPTFDVYSRVLEPLAHLERNGIKSNRHFALSICLVA
jgi:hypothetical protein